MMELILFVSCLVFHFKLKLNIQYIRAMFESVCKHVFGLHVLNVVIKHFIIVDNRHRHTIQLFAVFISLHPAADERYRILPGDGYRCSLRESC